MCGEAIAHLAGPWGLSHSQECALIALVDAGETPITAAEVARSAGYPATGRADYVGRSIVDDLRGKLRDAGLWRAIAGTNAFTATPRLLNYINQPSVCPLCRKDAEEKAYRKARKEGR